MTKKENNRNKDDVMTNHIEMCVYGLMRSGNHAIIEWIQQQYAGKTSCFLNNVKHGDNDPYLSAVQRSTTGIDRSLDTEALRTLNKHLLIYSYEDRASLETQDRDFISSVFQDAFDANRERYLGRSQHRFNVLIIRDPFNCFASRLKMLETRGSLGGVSDLALIVSNWKRLAERAVSLSRQPLPGEIVINYNRWVLDQHYRQQLSIQLLGNFNDESFDKVSFYGGGSSFTEAVFKKPRIGKTVRKCCKLLLKGKTREIPRYIKRHFVPIKIINKEPLFERWQQLAQHERFQQIFQDPEILALSEELFGELPGTREFVMSVSKQHQKDSVSHLEQQAAVPGCQSPLVRHTVNARLRVRGHC